MNEEFDSTTATAAEKLCDHPVSEEEGWFPMFLAPKDGRWIKVKLSGCPLYPDGTESLVSWIVNHNGVDGSSRTKYRQLLIKKHGGYWGKPVRGPCKSKPYLWKPLAPDERVVRIGNSRKIEKISAPTSGDRSE